MNDRFYLRLTTIVKDAVDREVAKQIYLGNLSEDEAPGIVSLGDVPVDWERFPKTSESKAAMPALPFTKDIQPGHFNESLNLVEVQAMFSESTIGLVSALGHLEDAEDYESRSIAIGAVLAGLARLCHDHGLTLDGSARAFAGSNAFEIRKKVSNPKDSE